LPDTSYNARGGVFVMVLGSSVPDNLRFFGSTAWP
jgi:hypothetical protein